MRGSKVVSGKIFEEPLVFLADGGQRRRAHPDIYHRRGRRSLAKC